MFTPWYTSSKIIEAIKRKIAVPVSQATFSEQDLLNFTTEELITSMVPEVLSFHEEYYVWSLNVPVTSGKVRYDIPDRAIGMKLRDVFYLDNLDNIYEMAKVSPEDKVVYQGLTYSSQVAQRYYLENNQIVLLSNNAINPDGKLRLSFFIRPSILVPEDRVCYVQSFSKTLTVDNLNLAAGDTILVNNTIFTAVSSAPGTNEFLIGATSNDTAQNLFALLNSSGLFSSIIIQNNILTLYFTDIQLNVESTTSGIVFQSTITIGMDTTIPENIADSTLIDFLQTKSGHRIKSFDVLLPIGSVSGSTLTLSKSLIPTDLVIGDYIASASECIIPQLPTDLHPMLIEKACARILASMGDTAGLGVVNDKISKDSQMQGMLIDNRVEGSPTKIAARKSLLRSNKINWNRRF